MTTPFETIVEVIKRHLPELQKPGTLSVRPGFEFANGWITGKAAVVVTVAKKKAPADMAAGDLLPSVLEGFPVDVHEATTLQATRLTNPKQFLEEAAKLVPERRPAAPSAELAMDGTPIDVPVHGLLPHTTQPHIDYTPAPHVRLVPITDTFTVECVASPDQGWPRLKSFLDATRRSLTVGLYDFTSAHVAATVETAVAGKKLELVLGHPPANPTADQSDEQTAHDLAARVGAGLSFAWSLDNHDTLSDAWIYPSAYHIKVAVRDSASVWLSSGNWNNSNQPDIDPIAHSADGQEARGRDRDWHVIFDHAGLAKCFEAYLAHDLEVAKPHSQPTPKPPATVTAPGPPSSVTPKFKQFFAAKSFTDTMAVTPLLTPDPGVYVDAVTKLVSGAQHTLYLQYQYVQPNPAAAQSFQDLIAAVVARHVAGVDVKIIASEFQTREHLEELQNLGFDVVNRVKIQANVHNKGIVVDGIKVLVSSQNWSTAGVLENRDAGVIVDHAGSAAYFQAIFLHDWNALGQHKLGA